MTGLGQLVTIAGRLFCLCRYLHLQNDAMLLPRQELRLLPIGLMMQVKKTGEETNGKSLEMEWTLLPHQSGTPEHVHPTADETYTVLQGVLEVKLNGEWQVLRKGETLTIPKGAAHTFRNPLATVTKVYNVHSPALKFHSYFSGLQRIVNKLAKEDEPLKPTLNVAIHLSMLMKTHAAEMQPVKPPPFAVSLLNRIGKWRGIKI